jgi:hypothetical protein
MRKQNVSDLRGSSSCDDSTIREGSAGHRRSLGLRFALQRSKEQQTVNNTFTLTGAKRSVEVDNVFGSVEVVGTSGDQVQMTVTRPSAVRRRTRSRRPRRKSRSMFE